jgi:hypothetical protein
MELVKVERLSLCEHPGALRELATTARYQRDSQSVGNLILIRGRRRLCQLEQGDTVMAGRMSCCDDADGVPRGEVQSFALIVATVPSCLRDSEVVGNLDKY